MQQAVARLRLLLADIESKRQQLESLARQFRSQLQHVPGQVIYGRASLEMALSAMSEIEDRLAATEATLQRLERVRSRVRQEMEALQLLTQVDEARKQLSALKQRAQDAGQADEEVQAEIRHLEEFIAENSQRAGRAITAGE
jgi:chromosome segregation ATPase